MNAKILLVLLVAAVAAADSLYGSSRSDESSEARYAFDWAVKDSDSRNDFGQQEARDGDNTQGSYSVHLPDGRLQTVTYYVNGDSGYIADVKYDGEARYDSGSFESRESPRYTAPSRPHTAAPSRPRTAAPSRPRTAAPSRPRPSTPARAPARPRFFSAESLEVRSPFRHASHESFEKFDFNSFEKSREDHSRFRSAESHEFFKVPKNPFIRDSNESF